MPRRVSFSFGGPEIMSRRMLVSLVIFPGREAWQGSSLTTIVSLASATVSVSYPGAQTLGDMNIVVVGWNDTASTVKSVADSAGNTYKLAIGPTSGTGLRQSIYYAPNIAGGSNTVTVTFSQAAAFPDIRILEYRGITTLDVTAGATGSSRIYVGQYINLC